MSQRPTGIKDLVDSEGLFWRLMSRWMVKSKNRYESHPPKIGLSALCL